MSFQRERPTAVMDIETYVNYFLVAFRNLKDGKTRHFLLDPENPKLDIGGIKTILRNFRVVTFNGRNYDMPILALALDGATNAQLKHASDEIIQTNLKPWEFEKVYGVATPGYVDHIDLIEVAPGKASLKIYAGRIHCKKMQDLPIKPETITTREDRRQLSVYCDNDTQNTLDLYRFLLPQIRLREKMSDEYDIDLRSKSDAQIAEAVIAKEIEKFTGRKVFKPDTFDRLFHYTKPGFIEFKTPKLQELLHIVTSTQFRVNGGNGEVAMPAALDELAIEIGKGVYRLGIGGLHSSESCASHQSDDECFLVDRDVTSYYPSIILILKLFPKHIGEAFLRVYKSIVDRRVAAKMKSDVDFACKVIADCLKIVLNGSFGKFGSIFSKLFSPNLMVQVTITGQLSLLMLIEALELAGIPVVSANTDGVVIKCPREMKWVLEQIIFDWELTTGFNTEASYYKGLYSRDVNNYIAITEKGKVKTKGAFADPGLQKNPQNNICVEAVVNFLKDGTDIRETIESCEDIRKFVTIRQVNGGAEKDGVYIGKAVRWYYAEGVKGTLRYITNGNTVARSEGAKPLMELPNEIPDDIDYNWYVREAYGLLDDIGVRSPRQKDKAFQGRTGYILARRPDAKNVHVIDMSTGKALCGDYLRGRHDNWVEYPAIPSDLKPCPKCKKEDL